MEVDEALARAASCCSALRVGKPMLARANEDDAEVALLGLNDAAWLQPFPMLELLMLLLPVLLLLLLLLLLALVMPRLLLRQLLLQVRSQLM